eukprot:scaffold2895_cov161-Prasinococcus_capsulatus_cf.AAC.1
MPRSRARGRGPSGFQSGARPKVAESGPRGPRGGPRTGPKGPKGPPERRPAAPTVGKAGSGRARVSWRIAGRRGCARPRA